MVVLCKAAQVNALVSVEERRPRPQETFNKLQCSVPSTQNIRHFQFLFAYPKWNKTYFSAYRDTYYGIYFPRIFTYLNTYSFLFRVFLGTIRALGEVVAPTSVQTQNLPGGSRWRAACAAPCWTPHGWQCSAGSWTWASGHAWCATTADGPLCPSRRAIL